MIKAIAIDDEPLALNILQTYCTMHENIKLEKTFTNQSEALRYISKYPVDVLFLDIHMPQKNGLEFYKNIDNNSLKIIFTTAYSQYAVDAFEINALDYLVKPFSYERFEKAISKIKINEKENDCAFLMIRADYKLHKIELDSILYIEALDDYIKIHLKNQQFITARQSLKNIQNQLPENKFVRVHRSFIVAVKEIQEIGHKFLKINGNSISIGDTYRIHLKNITQ